MTLGSELRAAAHPTECPKFQDLFRAQVAHRHTAVNSRDTTGEQSQEEGTKMAYSSSTKFLTSVKLMLFPLYQDTNPRWTKQNNQSGLLTSGTYKQEGWDLNTQRTELKP